MSREEALLIERKKIVELLDRINCLDYSAISEAIELFGCIIVKLLKGGKDEKKRKILL